MDLDKRIDSLKYDLIKSTQEILKLKSVEGPSKPGAPFGEDVHKTLECALDISKRLGFKTVDMDGYVGYAEYGEGDDYVAVLGHLDVVPEGDGWNYPPFGAEIHDGKIYARGSMDDKGPVMAALYGVKAVMDEKVKLSKKIRVIFGTNEETGCGEIAHYLKNENPPCAGFTPDAEYPIIYAEKGITIFDVVRDLNEKPSNGYKLYYIKGGTRANVVPSYCEAEMTVPDADVFIDEVKEFALDTGYKVSAEKKDDRVVIKSAGVSAHGSTPELGKNAIMQMFAFLERLNMGKCDITNFVTFFNKYAGMETDGKSFGVGLCDEESGKLSFNIGVVNMMPDKIVLSLNLRYPVTYKYDDMMDAFNKRIKDTGMKVENMMHQAPLYFHKDNHIIKSLQKVYTEETGKEATLLAIGGGTYAKEMPNIVAFGPIFPGEPDLDHQANEYIDINNMILNAKIYAHAVYELAK